MLRRFFRWLLPSCALLLPLLIVAGCSVYNEDYRYTPRPVVASVPAATTRPSDTPPVTAIASLIGVREAEANGIPPSVEINFQLNNDGSQTVAFDPHTMQLSDAGLTRFDPPIVRPEQPPITLDPAQSTTITAYFPFPPGRAADNMEMSSLQMRWTVHIGDRSVSQTVFFRQSSPTYYYYRPYYYYDDPYWYGGPYWYGPSVFVGPRVFIGPRFHHRRW